jgi:hypothetical protein
LQLRICLITGLKIEASRRALEKMGEPLGTQYSELWQELASIHIKWGEFVDAFGTA